MVDNPKVEDGLFTRQKTKNYGLGRITAIVNVNNMIQSQTPHYCMSLCCINISPVKLPELRHSLRQVLVRLLKMMGIVA